AHHLLFFLSWVAALGAAGLGLAGRAWWWWLPLASLPVLAVFPRARPASKRHRLLAVLGLAIWAGILAGLRLGGAERGGDGGDQLERLEPADEQRLAVQQGDGQRPAFLGEPGQQRLLALADGGIVKVVVSHGHCGAIQAPQRLGGSGGGPRRGHARASAVAADGVAALVEDIDEPRHG
ncbi:MAG TPA: hypothetical protein VGE07_28370, partial [Herpetosiphonaceae bacterium]